MTRTVLVCLLVVLTGFTVLAQAQPADDAKDLVEKKVEDLLVRGLMDQATAFLKIETEKAIARQDSRQAAWLLLRLSHLYRENGEAEAYINALLEAMPHAKDTDLDAPITAEFYLAFSNRSVESEKDFNPIEVLKMLESVREQLPRITGAETVFSIQSQELNVRLTSNLRASQEMAKVLSASTAEDLDVLVQVVLVCILKNTTPAAVGATDKSLPNKLPVATLKWLNEQRPWSKSLLQALLRLSDEVIALDRKRFSGLNRPELMELELAKDTDQRADIYDAFGDSQSALRLKREALASFDKHDIFIDAVIALDGITRLLANQKSPDATQKALATSNELIFRIERQTHAYVGQTLISFLNQFNRLYWRHLALLYKAYSDAPADSTEANKLLDALLVHADRLNLRPVRRDLAVFKELGDSIALRPEISAKLAEQTKEIGRRQVDVQIAKGKHQEPCSFEKTHGICVNDPYIALTEAKRGLVSVLEDVKRKDVGSTEKSFNLPSSLDQVRQGMDDSSAILMYFWVPTGQLYGAVISKSKPTRLVSLPNTGPDELAALVNRANGQLAVKSTEAAKTVQAVSQILWEPLLPLPEKLTVVLTPELLGIPFESLTGSNSEDPVVAAHEFRYVLGLSRSSNVSGASQAYRTGLVFGASTFINTEFKPLPASEEEVKKIRATMRANGIVVEPEDGLSFPPEGTPLFAAKKTVDLIHISTHSDLDLEVPMIDALVFPKDEVYAYNIALSSLRARLLVLSACRLFRPRNDSFYPVSGVAVASLARIAPQVVSTLWDVDSEATKIFMLYFYDSLLHGNDPEKALVNTKRMFLKTSELQDWLKSKKIAVPADIQSYSKPYFWAPFVLTVGLDDR